MLLILLAFLNQNQQKKYYALITKEGNGFEYEIYSDDRLIIKQSFIPATSGYRKFSSEEDARRVADLVLEKLNNGQSPSVTRLEINGLGIKTDYGEK